MWDHFSVPVLIKGCALHRALHFKSNKLHHSGCQVITAWRMKLCLWLFELSNWLKTFERRATKLPDSQAQTVSMNHDAPNRERRASLYRLSSTRRDYIWSNSTVSVHTASVWKQTGERKLKRDSSSHCQLGVYRTTATDFMFS